MLAGAGLILDLGSFPIDPLRNDILHINLIFRRAYAIQVVFLLVSLSFIAPHS